jgi:hypothetical protein
MKDSFCAIRLEAPAVEDLGGFLRMQIPPEERTSATVSVAFLDLPERLLFVEIAEIEPVTAWLMQGSGAGALLREDVATGLHDKAIVWSRLIPLPEFLQALGEPVEDAYRKAYRGRNGEVDLRIESAALVVLQGGKEVGRAQGY